jgi:hypothetical protein
VVPSSRETSRSGNVLLEELLNRIRNSESGESRHFWVHPFLTRMAPIRKQATAVTRNVGTYAARNHALSTEGGAGLGAVHNPKIPQIIQMRPKIKQSHNSMAGRTAWEPPAW